MDGDTVLGGAGGEGEGEIAKLGWLVKEETPGIDGGCKDGDADKGEVDKLGSIDKAEGLFVDGDDDNSVVASSVLLP